jgi:hypothetical protein
MKKISKDTHAAAKFMTAELLALLDPKGGYMRRRLAEAGPVLASDSEFILAAFMAALALSHAIEAWPDVGNDTAGESLGLN